MSRLSKAQADWLDKICRTNGGGVRIRCKVTNDGVVEPISSPLRNLYSKGLIQGKSGSFETVVHTREGLELWRSKGDAS